MAIMSSYSSWIILSCHNVQQYYHHNRNNWQFFSLIHHNKLCHYTLSKFKHYVHDIRLLKYKWKGLNIIKRTFHWLYTIEGGFFCTNHVCWPFIITKYRHCYNYALKLTYLRTCKCYLFIHDKWTLLQ